jgi:hypothetical protein
MTKRSVLLLAIGALLAGCGGSSGDRGGSAGAGAHGTAGAGSAGTTGGASAGAAGGTSTGTAGTDATAGSAGGGSAGASGAGGSSGAAGQSVGGASGGGAGGATDGGSDASGAGGGPTSDAAPGPSFLPAGYMGTPFTALRIPGRINACDYDRGGAGVAWCHNPGACGSGTTTGDWYVLPGTSGPYRPPIPASAKICGGAACDDNVGVCRMNPGKPDLTAPNVHAPADDTYLCYSTMGGGEWTKYTVVVEQAGTYAVGGFMAVPQGGGMNISFSGSGNITTGNLTLAVTDPVKLCGGGEYYHCWAQRENLATVTFPQAGTYLMTLTQTGRFNADNFTFTKM